MGLKTMTARSMGGNMYVNYRGVTNFKEMDDANKAIPLVDGAVYAYDAATGLFNPIVISVDTVQAGGVTAFSQIKKRTITLDGQTFNVLTLD